MKRLLLVLQATLWLLLVAVIIAFFVAGQADLSTLTGWQHWVTTSMRSVVPILVVFLIIVLVSLGDRRK
ncbi:hypothetical protein LOSG293_260050 [Secundilactobacillus oryzae JCM 18671]|uniref:DUF3923 family protein n=1 Tax=Secundilactobacillus oryzae JCM 18671 TaxID=1291743 RepID=A0A081BJX4_9LACO|nr:hypothetical protein [Secundilactobacillus oryzae]GAK48342.1 hypothetical protein LOSG293_260050 [Secundilactobacillus oryzae JCM 18671]